MTHLPLADQGVAMKGRPTMAAIVHLACDNSRVHQMHVVEHATSLWHQVISLAGHSCATRDSG